MEYYGAEDINHGSFVVKHWGKMGIKSTDMEKFQDWNNVRKFTQVEQLDENIKLHEVKQKLLIGMIP